MEKPIPIVWIMFDSLRKDVWDSTQNSVLSAWKERGCSFENVVSQSGFTLLSCSSMWTGKFPQHCDINLLNPAANSVHSWLGKVDVPVRSLKQPTIFDNIDNSQMVFRNGTTAWQFSAYVKRNIGQDLDRAETLQSVLALIKADRLQDDGLLFLRIFDTHLPYGRSYSPLAHVYPHVHYPPMQLARRRAAEIAEAEGLESLVELQKVGFQTALDQFVEPILAALDQAYGSRYFLIAHSDHGEQFGTDYREIGHGRMHSREVLHVPLLFCGPGITPQTVLQRVGLVDLAPTIGELRSLGPNMLRGGDGLSLCPVLFRNGNLPRAERVFFHNNLSGGFSVIRGEFKITRSLLDPNPTFYRSFHACDAEKVPAKHRNFLAQAWASEIASHSAAFRQAGNRPAARWAFHKI